MPIKMAADHKILSIDSDLNKIQDYDLLLERILYEARRVVNADAGSIYIREDDQIAIKYAQNDTKQKRLPPGEKEVYPLFKIPINEKSISGYVAMTGNSLRLRDVYHLPAGLPFSYASKYDQESNYKTTSMLTVPLINQDDVVRGVIQIINATDKTGKVISFTKADEELVCHFATKATEALQRARINRKLITRPIAMAEMRDPKETGAHVNRVAGYSGELYEHWAYKQGLPVKRIASEKDNFKQAAMLHDVGKVAISDLILKKPAKFTEEEYLIMQTHTWRGAHLFDDPESDMEAMALDVALTHHENWDGTGYPGWVDLKTGKPTKIGLDGRALRRKGEEISIWGRIVAIADVYDALVSARVYKQAWTEEKVLDELRAMKGSKFDPAVVDIFFEIYPRILQVRQRYPDAAAD
ncbi:MAG: phosphohydrolase [Spirochaetes bacterium GWD1_61_31]|nr:MAG: phosphohydrolase [Spirochaetes bacterium GWB1_60_80]OHD29079.1 MAG: phosphohydrolase [Spirochaetes bacterium GWC1_61_12]OHD43110.1 MAG: phosphohydrolase [Spirochaetes bacterium GWD1_61_31]OHD44244.1 MAG: phosphohydrolase [Spirochaetes bacterium GWE1_60_18]OHD60396.1 MAG: phosphohydrolase [Spirochaetes bacterium GWF1_60_12]HAP43288.1 phosphohydrolase [Spirochaetaceae bacterium]